MLPVKTILAKRSPDYVQITRSARFSSFDGSAAKALGNKLAAANTESVAHKVRFETSYQMSQYLEMFCGGSFTVAGQNVMRDRDTHGGFNVRF